MYVSVTGLKTKGVQGWVRFWFLAIPALWAARMAEGVRLVATRRRQGMHHTLTVWESRADMLVYKKSPAHLRSMRAFSHIATGRICGYECNREPTWDEALARFDEHAHEVGRPA